MENLIVEADEYTPHIHMDCETGCVKMEGESYAEDIGNFFTPIFAWIDAYFSVTEKKKLVFDFNLTYINSCTSKILMDLFDNLEEASKLDRDIIVNWHYDVDNEMGLMYGEEFKEGLESLPFNLVEEEETE